MGLRQRLRDKSNEGWLLLRIVNSYWWKPTLLFAILLFLGSMNTLRSYQSTNEWLTQLQLVLEDDRSFLPTVVTTTTSNATTTTSKPAAPSIVLEDDRSFLPTVVATTTTNATTTTSKPPALSLIPRRLPIMAKPNPFPPVEQVTEWMKTKGNETAGQFLMDLAIIGFAKCGTTTMMRWLGQHPEIQIPPEELVYLQNKEPWDMVQKLYKDTSTSTDPRILRGYKSPNDIFQVRAVRLLRIFFPQTKLIVGIRHPIWMMESFYNFRVQNGLKIVPFEQLAYQNRLRQFSVSLGRTEYHAALVHLGKTNQSDPAELALLPWKKPPDTLFPPSPHPVFLYDIEQLSDPNNATRMGQLLQDLQDFLGLTTALPPPIQISPGRKVDSATQTLRNALKIKICDEKYAPIREKIVVQYATKASQWILEYFVKHPDVRVANPEHFQEILKTYQRDPCLESGYQTKNATRREAT